MVFISRIPIFSRPVTTAKAIPKTPGTAKKKSILLNYMY